MRPTTERLWISTLAGIALLFHVVTLDSQSLFVDEVAELLHTRGSWSEVAFRADSMPPTYNLLLKGWVTLLGESSQARWISVAASLAAVLLVWRIGRRIGAAVGIDPARVGIASASVFAALPMQLYYAQLIRGYALMTFAAALCLWTFLRAEQRDRPGDWLAFALAGTFGMWCHYYFAITLLVLLGALIWRRRSLFVGRWAIASAGLIVVGCLPLLPFLQQDFGYQQDLREPRPPSLAAIGYTGFSYFSGYTLGPSKGELHQLSGRDAALAAAPWAAVVALAVIPLAWLGGIRLRMSRWLVPTGLLTLGPTGLVSLLGLATGITYNPRFVAWCVVPIAFWLGTGIVVGIAKRGRLQWVARGCTIVLAMICGMAIAQRHLVDRYRTEDLRATAQWIATNVPPDQVVFVFSDYLAPQLEFNGGMTGLKLPPIKALPKPGELDIVVTNSGAAEEAIEHVRQSTRGNGFWLVECRTFHTDPEGHLHRAIEEASRLEVAARFAGVTIYRGRLLALENLNHSGDEN